MGAKPFAKAAEADVQPIARASARTGRPARAASSDDAAVLSPALGLQVQLAERLNSAPSKSWSTRRTWGFILVTCGAFWLAAALLMKAAA